MENNATLYVKANQEQTLNRIVYYLNGDSRPDFEDEIPKQEQKIFQFFEFAEVPDEVYPLSTHEVVAYFEPDGIEEMEEIVRAVSLLKPDAIYFYFADDEDTREYYQGLHLVYTETVEDSRMEELNKKIPTDIAKVITETEDKGNALSILAKYFEQNK